MAIEYRWAEGRGDRLRRLADDLVKRKVAVIVTSGGPAAALAAKAATTNKIEVMPAANAKELGPAFAAATKARAGALLVGTDGLFTTLREQVVELADQHRIPTLFYRREFVSEGGLISYGPDYADAYRRIGLQVAQILKGAKPADMPVVQSSKFELVVNLKTAKKLGINIPKTFLARADEVIE